MAGVNTALKVPGLRAPGWWAGAAGQDVSATVEAALDSRSHRERWKYSPASTVLDLLEVPGAPPDLAEHNITVHNEPGQGPAGSIETAPEAFVALCRHAGVHVIDLGPDAPQAELNPLSATAPTLVRVADGVRVQLLETFAGSADQHHTLWVELGRNSHLTHSRNVMGGARQWNYLHVTVNEGAGYVLHNHTTGSPFCRQDVHIECRAPGASARLIGSACLAVDQHLDQQVTLEHQAPQTTSQQHVHTLVADNARATFNGRIHIHPGATGADAHLTNKNVALGANATINTKPELEIYTDDVKCSHGATVGRLDPQHSFYCAARGLPPQTARRLLCKAFLRAATEGPLADAAWSAYESVLA